MIVDSHCHLDYPDFKDDISDVLNRAGDAGISHMMTISVKLTQMDGVIEVANNSYNIFATVGIHPHYADEAPDDLTDQLRLWSNNKKIVGIGETGLDYFYEHSNRNKQATSFRKHIEISQETGLPVIVHTRDATKDTIEILTEAMKEKEFPFLIHCFSGTQDLADASIELGGYISISGIVTFKRADELRNIVSKLPIERILVETDAPYLAPVPHRGKRNEPAYTRITLEKVADLKNISLEDAARQTTDNYFNLFQKAVR